ncbi:MAG: hypothetical protein HOP12_14310 [Candidatus Eisenbacteria bacterium]|uniref:DUF6249 domain-containing protein n=1 Tax=Eiseniibacteriota bacterium TaxID=2212470 RepID=A0A849SND7_UNCEI|nr:hypothetical protein [Candidatus Eisenbacteria bacterium]
MPIDSDFIIPFLLFLLPVIAIIGGIVSGIIKQLGRQRLIELAQQERIAAIQRGLDPSLLAPLPVDSIANLDVFTGPESDRRRSQSFLVSGVITIFGGLGILVFLLMMKVDSVRPMWAVGLIPIMVGIALVISAMLLRPHKR